VKYVTVAQLATELGLDRSSMRKYVHKQGFSPSKIRTKESRGQLTLALSENDAETIRELRQSQGFLSSSTPTQSNGDGHFYIIQLVPNLAPNRVKLGFAGNVQARLGAHRTAAPTAMLVKSWPCKRSWERAVIASVTRIECACIGSEVFECENLDSLIERGNGFFGVMPVI
jgi:hypothetical protein